MTLSAKKKLDAHAYYPGAGEEAVTRLPPISVFSRRDPCQTEGVRVDTLGPHRPTFPFVCPAVRFRLSYLPRAYQCRSAERAWGHWDLQSSRLPPRAAAVASRHWTRVAIESRLG